MPEVDAVLDDPGPVLDRRGHAVRGPRFRLAAAPALHREHLVLGRHRLDRRDVDDLPALDRSDWVSSSGTSRSRSTCPAGASRSCRGAPRVPFRGPGLAFRPARLAAGLAAQRFRRRLRTVRRRGLRWSPGSSPSPGRRDPRPATAARPAARAAPRSPLACSSSWRPARPAAPAAACSQRETRHHRFRERRASRARPNVATTPPGPQIGRHRSDWTRRESAGNEWTGQTDLSSYKEVRENWLGFTVLGNGGHGLGSDFANALHRSLGTILSNSAQRPSPPPVTWKSWPSSAQSWTRQHLRFHY